MSVTFTSVLFSDEYTSVYSGHGGTDAGQNQLKGCVGDLIWAVIDGYVSWGTTATPMYFNTAGKYITRQDCNGSGSFVTDGFKAGDTITVTGTGDANSTNYTISKVTDLVLTLTAAPALTGAYSSVNIYGTTPISGGWMDYYANVVPNNYADDHFNSMTDTKVVQKYSGVIPAINSQNYLPPNARSWAWWDGYDINAGYYYGGQPLEPILSVGSTVNYKQYFRIIHRFFIKPFYTADQLQTFKDAFANSVFLNNGSAIVNNTDNGYVVPSYFEDNNCLKYIAQVDIRFNEYGTAVDHTSEGYTWLEGNTAWFNDTPVTSPDNADVPIYTLHSVTYTDVATSASVDAIDFTRDTTVTIKINDIGFHSSDPFVVNFMWLPTNASSYANYNSKANPATFRTVFVHDRCFALVAGAAVNGDQYGTGYQVIKGVTSSIGGGYLTITFTASCGSLVNQLFANNSEADRNYMIWVTPQDKNIGSLARATRNGIICDINTAYVNTDNSALLVISTDGTTDEHFFRFPDEDVNPVTNYAGVAGDFAYSKIGFKTNGKIKSIRTHFDVLVYDATVTLVDTMTLEDWSVNVSDTYNGVFNDIFVDETRGFPLPDGDLRNTISIVRDATLDGGGYYGFKFIYGFQLGYQWWQFVSPYAAEFIDYATNYWPVYTQGYTSGASVLPSGYTSKIIKVTEWVITDPATGLDTQFQHNSRVSANDQYLSGWKPTLSVATKDTDGNSLNGAIASDAQTEVVCTLAGNGINIGVAPAPYTTLYGLLQVWYDNGSSQVCDSSNTIDANLSTSIWVGQPIVTVNSPASVTITGIIDPSLSPTPITIANVTAKLGYYI